MRASCCAFTSPSREDVRQRLTLFFECALFVVGLALGSFLNVCISRIPRSQSIVAPRSHCPACGTSIRWYDNVPVLSWILLRRRCRACGTPISLRYPAVELLTAFFFVASFALYGTSWLTVKSCVFCFLLLGLIFMDAETGLLPREFTYSGIVLGLALSCLAPTDSSGTQLFLRTYGWQTAFPGWELPLLDALLGALVGAGFFYVAWALYYLVRKRHGMGFGDIALMAMSGTFLGLKLTVFVLFTAPLLGAVYAVGLLVRNAVKRAPAVSSAEEDASPSTREMFSSGEFPFGVFLGACSLAAIFVGEAAWRWYLGFF